MAYIFWLFGLSGAGKTTLGRALEYKLKKNGYKVERLDGDISRMDFTKDLGFTIKDRFTNVRRNAWLAYLLAKNDIMVVACFTTPTRAMRLFLKNYLRDKLVLVWCNSSLETCIKRDVKGLYEQALNGIIDNFVGFDIPFETPHSKEANFMIDTEHFKEEDSILDLINEVNSINDKNIIHR